MTTQRALLCVLPSALLLLISACSSPEGSVPAPPSAANSAPAVTHWQSQPYQTLDVGPAAETLCLIQAVSGSMHDYIDAGDAAAYFTTDGGCTDLSCETRTALFVSGGEWYLLAEGAPFSVAVACAPWSAFGLSGPPAISRVDEEVNGCVPSSCPPATTGCEMDGCGGIIDCGGCATPSSDSANEGGVVWRDTESLPGASACVLSSLGGDLAGGSTEITGDGGLYAVSPPGSGSQTVQVSATCFGGLSFVDVPLGGSDAGGSTALPGGLCGLSAIGGMTSTTSSVDVSGAMGSAQDARATARCLLYPPPP
jgi:hypothetical protein